MASDLRLTDDGGGRHRKSKSSRRSKASSSSEPWCCSLRRKHFWGLLLLVSLALNMLQLAGMHAVLPDGLVRARTADHAASPIHSRLYAPPASQPPRPPATDAQPTLLIPELPAASEFAPRDTATSALAQPVAQWEREHMVTHATTQLQPAAARGGRVERTALIDGDGMGGSVDGMQPAAAATAAAAAAAAASATADAAAAATTATTAAAAAAPVAAVPNRHPVYRLAFTVPWIGGSFPSWFPYFLSSCRRSAFLVDWLIFHEDAKLPSAAEELPPNVVFYNLGKEGLAKLFGSKIAAALGGALPCSPAKLVELFRLAFREFSYIVTEYKPTHGVVFADYLRGYSHWSYTDIDQLSGDFPAHIELAELRDYDIFTYHFGDVFRLYLRGQFCAHRNVPRVNQLWVACPHLGSGLARELETKWAIIRRLAQEGKHGRTRFISAEGCYSAVVADAPELRVKFAAKAFADWYDDPEFYVVDGALRRCADHAAWRAGAAGQRCNPFGPRIAAHSLLLPGAQRPRGPQLAIRRHRNCSRWVEERYRVCANLSEETSGEYNVMLHHGVWTAQRYVNAEPEGALEGAFLHLQRWKAYYKRMRYGSEAMPRLRGRRIFRLSTRGFTPLDLAFSDEHGANASAAPPPPPSPPKQQKPLQEIIDVAEFEAQVLRLV